MAASDYVPIFFKNRLRLEGRPQMSTRPIVIAAASLLRAARGDFLRAVAGKLPAQPTDAQVREAIAGAIG
jgi:hypothetical protein